MLVTRSLLAAAAFAHLAWLPQVVAEGRGPARRAFSGDLTLNEAVKIALRQNPDLLKQLQEIERTRGQIIEISAQALPQLTLSGGYSQQARALLDEGSNFGSGGNGSGGGSTIVVLPGSGTVDTGELQDALSNLENSGGSGSSRELQTRSWQISLEVKQVVYSGGQVSAAIRIAQFARDASYFQLRDIIDQVVANVRSQFTNTLTTRALIKVAEESVKLQEDQLRDQRNRFEAGTVPRFNVLRAEVELANVQPDLIRGRNNYLLAELALAKTLGLDPGPGGKPTFNAVGTLGIAERPLSLPSALEVAHARRPFLKVQRQQILQQAEQIKIALAGYKPRLDVNAGYEVRNSRVTDDLDRFIDGWFFGVTGSWNIFDGFATKGKVIQARAQLESAKINYDDSVQQVDLEVQTAFANLQTARETIKSQQKNVEQALEALRLASERFSAGAGTQLEILDARTALTTARSTELQARGDYNTALAEFDRTTATDTFYSEFFRDPLEKVERKVLSRSEPKAAPKKALPMRAPKVKLRTPGEERSRGE